MENEILRCSFCNKSQKEVLKLIAGPTVFICDACVDVCLDIIKEDRLLRAQETVRSAQDLRAALDAGVIGQSAAKVALSAVFSRHHFRITSGQDMGLGKSNVLLVGPAGSGKTLSVMLLASELGLPFAAIDATRLADPFYFKTINLVEALYETAYDPQAAAQEALRIKGVVCIENLDRIAARKQRNDPGLQAQETLLEVLEGGTVEIFAGRGRTAKIQPKDVLFVGCGKFPDLSLKLGSEGVIRFGFLPELAARFPICIGFEALTATNMAEILTKPDGLLREYIKLFEVEGLSLSVTQGAIEAIAREAARRQGGARSLRALLEHVALEVSSEMAAQPGLQEYVVDDTFIRDRIGSVADGQ